MEIKTKITKQLIKNGTKTCSEKILIKSIKEIQKTFKIKSKDLLVLTIRNINITYKMHKFQPKKRKKKKITEIPGFVLSTLSRTSHTIKNLINKAKTNKNMHLYLKLKTEIISNSRQLENASVFQKKLELQKNIFTKNRIFRYHKLH